MEATWATHLRSVSGLMRVLMTHALTRLDRVGNTSNYLRCQPSAKTEEERRNAAAWRKVYVSCGCDHDPITRLLMCEGECTCSADSQTCVLGKIIAEVDNLVRSCRMHAPPLTQVHTVDAVLRMDEGTGRYATVPVRVRPSKTAVQAGLSNLPRDRQILL